MPSRSTRPLILGIGGTTRTESSSERALQLALTYAERAGGRTDVLAAGDLDLPMYAPDRPDPRRLPGGHHDQHHDRPPDLYQDQHQDRRCTRLLRAVTDADGLVISTPAYHGGISGLIKNALDWLEDLREDERPYLDGRAVGCIVSARGWQATATTLVSLRSVVHALRGWPTPLGVVINSAELGAEPDTATGTYRATDEIESQLAVMAAQVVDFAYRQQHAPTGPDGCLADDG